MNLSHSRLFFSLTQNSHHRRGRNLRRHLTTDPSSLHLCICWSGNDESCSLAGGLRVILTDQNKCWSENLQQGSTQRGIGGINDK
uniref:Uncharacterized protein n=1 Tax=Nelumbo nucifera TaxID=4432 RepID=A0A822YIS0_NELNU|nr:TPA_asm: hypothetical protein HUJ06_010242 [Nelumbo nucifera]